MPGAGIESGVAQAVELKVHAGQAIGDAELGPEDLADVPEAEGADAVGRGRAGVDALAEGPDRGLGQESGLSGARAVTEGVGPLGVVAGDPPLDGPP